MIFKLATGTAGWNGAIAGDMPPTPIDTRAQPRGQGALDRLATWFLGGDRGDRADDPRERYDRIGDFLFDNDLEPSTANFDFASRLMRGPDTPLAKVTRVLIEANGRLTDRDVARIVERCSPAPDTSCDRLGALGRELEEKVAECLAAVGESTASASTYSDELDAAAGQLASDPAGAYRRLLASTLEVAETSRKIGGRLEHTRAETQRLQADLDRAVRDAEEDVLTGLPNRRGFVSRIERALAAPDAAPVTVALCDVDDFKRINDHHGHDTGDRVLRFVAHILREELPHDVFVARYGGEEFAVLFEGTDVEAATALLDDARIGVAARTLRDQVTGAPIGRVTFSAGVAQVAGEWGTAIRCADMALYAAKNGGKDQVLAAAAGDPVRPH